MLRIPVSCTFCQRLTYVEYVDIITKCRQINFFPDSEHVSLTQGYETPQDLTLSGVIVGHRQLYR